MQRVTVTIADELAAAARADVAAGREPSLSAWVADAMQRKALARAELAAELDEMTAERPYDRDTVSWVAETLGRPTSWVSDRLPGVEPEQRIAR